MICSRPDCPIQFRAQAMEAYRAQEKIADSNADTETCEHCSMCKGALVCWERRVRFADDGTRTVELRRKLDVEGDAA